MTTQHLFASNRTLNYNVSCTINRFAVINKCNAIMQSVSVAIILLSMFWVQVQSREPHQEHQKRLEENQYRCGNPQPRVFEINELTDTRVKGKKLIPYVTILHRCECTGYCKNKKERCMVTETGKEIVTLHFSDDKNLADVFVQEVNHTKCGCGRTIK